MPSSPTQDPLAEPSIGVWIRWYFTRGSISVFTVPVFLFLTYCIFSSAVRGVIIFLALLRASGASFGFMGAFIAISLGWMVAALPAVLYYSLIKNISGLWLRRDVQMKSPARLASTVGIAIAEVAYFCTYRGVGWIADRNPCAAFKAGVTGTIPPGPDCR